MTDMNGYECAAFISCWHCMEFFIINQYISKGCIYTLIYTPILYLYINFVFIHLFIHQFCIYLGAQGFKYITDEMTCSHCHGHL